MDREQSFSKYLCPNYNQERNNHAYLLFLNAQLSRACDLRFSCLLNLVCERHIKASPDFAVRILGDHQHPLHEDLLRARSYTPTRSRFKTATYRNSVLLVLSQLLVDWNTELGYCLQELSWYVPPSPFQNCVTVQCFTLLGLSKKLKIVLSK